MPKKKPYKRRGRPPVHAGYSLVKPPAVRKYLTHIRGELIGDLGGEENISCQQVILVDAVINLLAITRSIEEHIRGKSVMVDEDVAPALRASYLAYRNSIQRHLALLGLDQKTIAKPIYLEEM